MSDYSKKSDEELVAEAGEHWTIVESNRRLRESMDKASDASNRYSTAMLMIGMAALIASLIQIIIALQSNVSNTAHFIILVLIFFL